MRMLAIFLVFLLSACSALWESVPKLEQPKLGETIELHKFSAGDVNNQGDAAHPLEISNGRVTFRYGEQCELDPAYHHYVTVVALGYGTVLLRYSGDHPDPNEENRHCFDGILFNVGRDNFDNARYRDLKFKKENGSS